MIAPKLKRWQHVWIPYRIRPVRGLTFLTKSALDLILENASPQSVKRFTWRRLAGKFVYVAWEVK